jgi:nucleotide-binding universal stress UspA family protein
MSILCATNFSDRSKAAATGAARLALAMKEPLLLVHAVSAATVRAAGEPLRRLMQELLQAEAQRLSALGAKVETSLVEGPIAESVSELARKRGATLVVAGGYRKESAFGGMGGSLDRLSLLVEPPLAVLKDPAVLGEWLEGRRPLRVMLGVDPSPQTVAARAWLRGLERLGPIDLVAARVFYPGDEAARLELPPPVDFMNVPPEMRVALENEVRTLVGEPPAGRSVAIRVRPGIGRQADQLVDLAIEERVDLIVVGTHHRRGISKLWSVSHHTLRLAPMSVAVVPGGQ